MQIKGRKEDQSTRDMLNIMRGKKHENKTLMEDAEQEEVVELDGDQLKEEQEKFRESVSKRAEFYTFKIYPESNNAVFAGTIPSYGDMEWYMTLEEHNGIYVSVNSLNLTNEVIELMNSLMGYYENWSDEWSTKVQDEY